MLRPNLAGRPFLDTRPVVALGLLLALAAVALTTVSVSEFVSRRGEEHQIAGDVDQLQTRRGSLAGEVNTLDRQLARVPWRKLKAEAASMRQVVVQRRLVWSTLFVDLERVLPWDVRLVSIDPQADERGEITVAVSGVAANRAAWLKLLGRLFTDTHFSEPIPGSEEAPGEQNTVGFRFTLRVRYWPEGRP